MTDPLGSGFVPNLARPGGNLTGFTNFEFAISGKWLQTLKEVAPAVKRIAVMFNPQTAPYAEALLQPIEVAARTFAVAAMAAPAADVSAIEAAVTAFAHTPNGGLIVLPDVSTAQHRDLIIALAARRCGRSRRARSKASAPDGSVCWSELQTMQKRKVGSPHFASGLAN